MGPGLQFLSLVVGNLRLVIENYMKYGVLVQLSGSEFRRDDLKMFFVLYALIPAHLFVGFLIELVASIHARGAKAKNRKADNKDPKLRVAWRIIAFAHVVNATLSLGVANWVVYYKIHHPLIGTFCEFHAGMLHSRLQASGVYSERARTLPRGMELDEHI